VIGNTKEISNLVKKYDVGLIVITDQNIPMEDYRAIINLRDTTLTKLVILPDIVESLLAFSEPVGIEIGNGNDSRAKTFNPCNHCLARKAILRMDKNSGQ
jgi:hypothetical protein